MRLFLSRFGFAVILVGLLAVSVSAAAPAVITYQGRLTNPDGTPVTNMSRSTTFTIYDAVEGGTILWTEDQMVWTDNGLFTVVLGYYHPISDTIFNGATRYLGTRVGAGIELIPRVPLVSVPYALRVSTVNGAAGGTISGNLQVVNLQATSLQTGNLTGNLKLDNSSAVGGNMYKGDSLFLHNYGLENTFVGRNAGNLTMTGGHNTGIGYRALNHNADGTNNTAVGEYSLSLNTAGSSNVAVGIDALHSNVDGYSNVAVGREAMFMNSTGMSNTAIGDMADMGASNLVNATAIGHNAVATASNTIRLGDDNITKICGKVGFTTCSDRNEKENLQGVDGTDVLSKISRMHLTSWNYKNQDPAQFRHYGPMAQDFFAAFGKDGVGTCGDSVTINSSDMAGILMIAVQALVKDRDKAAAENAELKARVDRLEAKLEQVSQK